MLEKVIFLLMAVILNANIASAQPSNDECVNAIDLCPNQVTTFSNINASTTQCINCEDDFNFCYSPHNTIWFKFTTNQYGGAVLLTFSNLHFETAIGQSQELEATLIQAVSPCAGSSYSYLGNCVSNGSTNFSINEPTLAPNSTYYVVVGGNNVGNGITIPAECTFNVLLSGGSVNRGTPSMTLTPTKNSICKNDIVSYKVDMINCPDSTNFKWFVNDTLVAVTIAPFYQTASLKDGDIVSCQTTCFKVCVDTVKKSCNPINVNSIFVDAGSDQTIQLNQTVFLGGNTTAPVHYWTPGFTVADSNSLITTANITQTTTYILTAVKNGCKAFDQVTISLFEDILIPTTFSPNGDGINDKFEIKYIENYPENIVKIYDRWGQLMYKTGGYNFTNCWNGKKKDGEFAEGVYFYVIELNDSKNRVYNGSITIIK